MKVKQIATFVNETAKQALGLESVVAEDLSNVIDAGKSIENIDQGYENFIRKLPDVIGKQVIIDKAYVDPDDIDIDMDSYEFGGLLEQIRTKLPEAEENNTWKLIHGRSYDEDVFEGPDAKATFYADRTTFECRMCFPTVQAKSAFTSADKLNGWISSIYTQIANSIKIRLSNLKMRLLCNQIAETLYQETSSGVISGRTGIRGVNLLYEYKQTTGANLTAAEACTTPEFLRFAAYRMNLVQGRLKKMSGLFTNSGWVTFAEEVRTVLLDEFAKAIGPYSLASSYNEEYLTLPNAKTVTCWQGTGTGFAFADNAKVDVSETAQGHAKTVTGVLGVMFGRGACVVANSDARVTSKYNADAEFTKEWHKVDAQYLVDDDEPFVVFYVA